MISASPLRSGLLATGLAFAAAQASAAVLFSDAFNSANGTALAGTTGWTQITGTGPTPPLTINNQALTVQSVTSGGAERVYTDLGQTYSSGSLFVGFDLTVTDAPGANVNLAFFASDTGSVGGSNSGSYFNIGVGDSGGFKLGIATANNSGPSGTASVQTTASYSLNTTYRVVVEYNFINGALNNTANLYINGSVVASAVYGASPAEVAGFRYFAWRQPTLANSTAMNVDDFVISTDYASAATFAAVPEPSSYAACLGAAALLGVALHRRRSARNR